MKWMLMIGVTIAAILALAAFVGSRLPRSHRASREQTLSASPEAIWIAITDVEAFPSWRDIKKVQRLPDLPMARIDPGHAQYLIAHAKRDG